MVAKRRRNPAASIKCVDCVTKLAEDEARAAAEKAAASCSDPTMENNTIMSDGGVTTTECASCHLSLSVASFSAKQRRKQDGLARCLECVAAAEADELNAGRARKLQALLDAQEGVNVGESTSAIDKVRVAVDESAAEAEFVIGIKPIVLGRGRGKSWRGRGRAESTARRTRGS
jgi:Stc1 domain